MALHARKTTAGDYEIYNDVDGAVIVTITGGAFVPPNVAVAQVLPGIPVEYHIDVANAATNDVDVVLTKKTLITDVEVIKTGGNGAASNTITVKNGANAISDAIDMNVNDKVVKRAGEIDDAQSTIAAGGTLRVASVKSGGNAACKVIVRGVLVA